MSPVTAIIPARNEAATVGGVVRAVRVADLAERIIVVSDGSTDETVSEARLAGADLVVALPEGVGKGGAMRTGARLAATPVLLFLDADLKTLSSGHQRALLEPILADEADMVVGVIRRGAVYTWLSRFTPKISGQRAVRRDLVLAVPENVMRGYAAEIALNRACRRAACRSRFVFLDGLDFRRKYEKLPWWRAWPHYLSLASQIGWAGVRPWAAVKVTPKSLFRI
jgi:glycosyltransferase involved in cell wall biosynthesis